MAKHLGISPSIRSGGWCGARRISWSGRAVVYQHRSAFRAEGRRHRALSSRPPENGVVLSVDEKPQIQAWSVPGWLKCQRQGAPGFTEYKVMHGRLFAAMEVAPAGQRRPLPARPAPRVPALMNRVATEHGPGDARFWKTKPPISPKHDRGWRATRRPFYFNRPTASWLNRWKFGSPSIGSLGGARFLLARQGAR